MWIKMNAREITKQSCTLINVQVSTKIVYVLCVRFVVQTVKVESGFKMSYVYNECKYRK